MLLSVTWIKKHFENRGKVNQRADIFSACLFTYFFVPESQAQYFQINVRGSNACPDKDCIKTG